MQGFLGKTELFYQILVIFFNLIELKKIRAEKESEECPTLLKA